MYIRPIRARLVQGKSRRRKLVLAGMLAGGIASVALYQAVLHESIAGSAHAATAAKQGSKSRCPKHPPPFIHDSFPEPAFKKSRNGVLDSKLTADVRKARIDGKMYTTSVYNGTYPGPTFMLCPGDTWNLTLHNHLKPSDFPGFDEDGMAGMTNIHTHGFHVSPLRPQDNIFVKVRPGKSYHYHYEIPNHERAGAYWYHPHMHTQANPQEMGGMEGAIVMRGGLDNRPAYQDFGQRVLDVTQTALGNGQTVQPGPHGPFIPQGTKMFVNGHLDPKIPIHPGEIQRWQIDNLNADSFVKLKLRGHKFQLLARDGNYLPRRKAQNHMLISPSSRREVLVRGGKHGSAKLVAMPFRQFGPGSKTDPQTLATLVSRGHKVDDHMPPKKVHKYHDLRAERPVQQRHRIVYTQDPPNFFINGKKFNPDRIDQTMTLGKLNEWTIINKTPFWHTFHIHIQDFQVISRNGHKLHGINQNDNVSIGPNGGVVKMLTFPRHYHGKFVFHCHILGHEDNGMMGTVRVKKPGHG